MDQKITFSFGENWMDYNKQVTPEEIASARQDLLDWIGSDNIAGRRVLDLGCGSGIHSLGLYNTRWALILLFMGTDIVSIYIFIQFMRSIPQSLDEAARLDGAGHLRIFLQVIIPNLKPAIATVVIIKGIAIYNEFYAPFLYITDPKLRPISTALFAFKGPFGAHWEIISAGVVITIIPILLLFLFLQTYIYNGFTSGATK